MIQGYSDLLHSGFQFLFVQFTLPQNDYLPTGVHQFVVVPLVAFAVAGYLCLPEICVGFRQDKLLASLLNKEFYVCSANLRAALTPRNVHRTFLRCGLTASSETAVDEDSRSILAHDYIRLARYALDIQPVSIPVCPQPSPHRHFRLGRLTVYMRHAAVTLLWG